MEQSHNEHGSSPYRRLLVMAGLSFAAMYALMYAMVDRFANVYMNFNQIYMTGLMAAPMVLVELLVMRGMYRSTRANAIMAAASLAVFLICFGAIRVQAGISDKQFLRSMIPHHAGAILMCEQASLRDSEVQALCKRIRASQAEEIAQMEAKLSALNR
jgi:hypothetical protein